MHAFAGVEREVYSLTESGRAAYALAAAIIADPQILGTRHDR